MTQYKEKEKRPVKDDWSTFRFIVFGFLTLGIYEIWVSYHLIQDVKYLFEDEDTPLPSFWKYLFYTIFTLGIYNIYYWLTVSDLMRSRAIRNKLTVEISSGLIAACFILGYFFGGIPAFVSYNAIFASMNTIAEDHNRKLQ